jgi:hypothetical protein
MFKEWSPGTYGDWGDFLMENITFIKPAKITNQFPADVLDPFIIKNIQIQIKRKINI